MWTPWQWLSTTEKPPSALTLEMGEKVQLVLPGGKTCTYRLTSCTFSQGGHAVDATFLSDDLVKEKYWVGEQ